MTLEPGDIIGSSYRIVRPLGEGGMGAVYEVEHTKLGVHYALKTYTLEDENAEMFRKRFAVEGRLLARLNHPNLVRVIDLDTDPERGILYYVMDLVLYKDGNGYTLADIDPGGADEDQIFEWFCQLCDALAYVHSQGIVHRDIKLNNILIAPDHHAVLSDFGISRVFDDRMRGAVGSARTMTTGATHGWAMGTQGYMAPEVERGEEATPAADVYSLGVAFFKLLTGLWYEPNLAPGAGGATDAQKLLADFERPWRDVLPVMLNANPADRPTNLRELPEYLMVSAEGESSTGSEVIASETGIEGSARQSSGVGKMKLAIIAGLGVLLLAAVLSALLLLRGNSAAPSATSPDAPPEEESSLDDAYSVPESLK